MASLNKVFLIGNLTRDPELRYTQTGKAVTDFGLAVNRSFTDKNGTKRDSTVFVDITLWGRLAEVACEFLSKGKAVFVEGRLNFQTWEKEGQRRNKISVVAENIQFLGAPGAGKKIEEGAVEQPPAEREGSLNIEEEDIPF